MKKVFKNIVNEGIYGKEPLFEVREISTIRDMFESSTKMFASRTAFMQKPDKNSPYKKITYNKFRDDVYGFATGLINIGLKGKKIAVIGENRYEWALSYMSVVSGVGTVVPIDKELPYEEVKYLLDFAECDAIICTNNILRTKPELATCGILCICMDDNENCTSMKDIIDKGNKLLEGGNTDFADSVVYPDDVNVLLFTSGTTGVSKGVMLSHRNLCSNMMNTCAVFKINQYDRVFSLLPLHHTYECTCGFLCEIYVGASIAYCQGLKYIVKNMQESKPTMFFAVPLVLESIYKMLNKTLDKKGKTKTVKKGIRISKALLKVGIDIRRKLFKEIIDQFGGRLKMFLVGAAHIDAEILQFFTDLGITSIQGYGMTECSPLIAANRGSYHRNEAVGLPLPEVAVKISNPDADGVGEVVVKGENVMVGYYKNQEETDNVLKDGWLYTGDMGYLEDGFLYLTGRVKNVIITANGKNVFPEEIEGYLSQSKYIDESLVYESEHDGKKIITAQIYPDFAEVELTLGKEYSDDDLKNLLSEEIKAINKTIPTYKAVGKFLVRKDQFVKTTTQKIKREANI